MGCDIHAFVEVKTGGDWQCVVEPIPGTHYHQRRVEGLEPFEAIDCAVFWWRNYDMFALFGVESRGAAPRLFPSKLFVPDDSSFRSMYANWWPSVISHSLNWMTLADLLAVDYTRTLPDGTSLAETLGSLYFTELEALKKLSPDPAHVRIVMDFDN
nr:hypothetical protein [Anaerolineae bacterium]